MKRKRTYNARLIRARLTYTISEIATLFGLHIRTVQRWYKQGLIPVEVDTKPLLFTGNEIKRFLEHKRRSGKIELKDGEFYCPKCRQARSSAPRSIGIIDTKRRIGRDDYSVHIKGICQICSCKLTRFSTRSRLKSSIFTMLLTQADRGLEGDYPPTTNTDI